MEELRKQPFLTFCVSFTLASFILIYGNKVLRIHVFFLFLLSAAVSVLFMTYRFGMYKKRASALLPICLAVMSASGVQYIYKDITLSRILSYSEVETNITAVVEKTDLKADYAAVYTVKICSVNEKKTSFRAKLVFNNEFDTDKGEILSLNTVFSLPDENENGFPLRQYYASRGIYLIAEAEGSNTQVIGKSKSAAAFFASLSDKLSAKLTLRIGNEYGGLASGLLLGRRDDVPDSVKRDFRFLGISHILAVSGLHLSILVGGFLLLLRFFKIPRTVRFILCSVLIVFMMFLTGFPASVIRSGIMMFIFLLGNCIGREDNSLLSLFTAGTVIITVSPESLTDAGFLLSFSATLGLITLGKKLSSAVMKRTSGKTLPIRLLGKLLCSLSSTISAILFTLPFTYLYFGEISIVSPLSNLIFVPLSGIFLFLSAGVLLFSGGVPAALFYSSAKSIAAVIIDLASFFAEAAPEPISLQYDFTVIAFVFALLSCVFLLFLKKKNILLLLIPFIIWAGIFSGCYLLHTANTADHVNILAVNLKKNDFILINRGGKTLICDFSDGTYTQAKRAAALTKNELCDASADALLLTHLHRYHIATFRKLADNNRLEYLIMPEPYDEKTADIAKGLKEAANERNISVITYSPDNSSTLDFSGCSITISETVFIDRSVQPIMFLSVDTGNGVFSYFSSAVFESELSDKAINLASHSDAVWYGIHGPVIKNTLPEITVYGKVIVSSPAVNEGYEAVFDEINNGERCFIKFRSG